VDKFGIGFFSDDKAQNLHSVTQEIIHGAICAAFSRPQAGDE
jgi:hypothetical protein